MRKWLVLALFASTLVPAMGQHRDTSAEESKILALENAWNQAEEHQDTHALDQPTSRWSMWTTMAPG